MKWDEVLIYFVAVMWRRFSNKQVLGVEEARVNIVCSLIFKMLLIYSSLWLNSLRMTLLMCQNKNY